MKRNTITETSEDQGRPSHYFANPQPNLSFIPSGSTLLDCALGGGWAVNRISNIIGDKSSGKTLSMIEAAANFAKKYPNGKIIYNEAEAAFDINYAEALGMPVDRVEFVEDCFTVEEFFEDIKKHVDNKEPSLYMLDSLDALSDKAEQERDIDEGTYGATKAKQMSALFRQLTKKIAKSNITLMLTSQIRDDLSPSFVKKPKRSGGRALDFYASQVLYLVRTGAIKQQKKGVERTIGITVKGKVDKNKVALPYREAAFDILFGYGIDNVPSNLAWLNEVKAPGLDEILADFMITATTNAKTKAKVNSLSDDNYFNLDERLDRLVRQYWSEIEQGFLPTRSKY